MARIAFLGLGAMGSRMAAHLLSAGHELTVWSRDPTKAEALIAAGARVAQTPRQAAEGAALVFAMVRDDQAARSIWLDPQSGALAGMSPGSIAIECSTLGLEHMLAFGAAAAKAGIECLDAPVAGSRPQAEAKALIFFVGGAESVLTRARSMLLEMGASVHHAGPIGAGMTIKLAVNGLLGVQAALMAELLAMVRRHGLDPGRALEIIGATPVCAPAAKLMGEMMVRQAFAPLFPIELLAKDLDYALAAGGPEPSAPILGTARDVFTRAIAAGFGQEHFTAVTRLSGG